MNDRPGTSRFRHLACLLALFTLGGCRHDGGYRLAVPMPPHTVLLSVMVSDLAAQPGFTDQFVREIGLVGKTGAALFPPGIIAGLRSQINAQNWHALDEAPGVTMQTINPAVGVIEKVARAREGPVTTSGMRLVERYVDVESYKLDEVGREDLDRPSTFPGFPTVGVQKDLGNNIVEGDAANPAIAPMHSESARLADVMNRLALNRLQGAAPFVATIGGKTAVSPEDLLRALAGSGHQVMVADARYFANFGHLHYDGYDVMMPFIINTQVMVPHTGHPLSVPVAHAEYEWFVRGPKINADISFYYGVDGKAEFRTMDTLDQAWVMGRHAHEYTGADAVEATRLTGLLVLAYAHEHLAHPALPFGGYYTLGVCQDGVAAIELKMTGASTLFPNTADASLFDDPRDGEINALIARIPKDRDSRPVGLERIFGSLPTEDLAAVSIPRLAPDLIALHTAWLNGTLGEAEPLEWWQRRSLLWSLLVLVLASGWAVLAVQRRMASRRRRR